MAACTNQDLSSLKIETTELFDKIESEGTPYNQKVEYLDHIYSTLSSYKNDSITRNLLFKTSVYYYNYGYYDKYFNLSKNLYDLSLQEQDTSHIAKSLYYIGDYYDNNSKADSALYYYTKASKFYSQIKDTLNIGRTTLYKAGIFYDIGNYTESEIEAVNALPFLLKKQNTRLVYECYNLIALSLEEQNSLDKSLQYFNLALEQLEKLESENYPAHKILRSLASCYNNMGSVYEKKGNYSTAINLYRQGLQTKGLKANKPHLYAMLLNNLAHAKMQSNDLNNVKNLLFDALDIRDSLNINAGIVSSKIRIGEYYLLTKDTASALKYLKDGYVLSRQISSHHDILNSLKLLSTSDSNNSVYYSLLYIKVSDSLRNVERATRNKFARIAYEADEIEAKNELLLKQNTKIIIGSSILLVFLTGIFAIYRLNTKNRELLLIQEQQAANEHIYKLMLEQQDKTKKAREEERNKIAMELHDGIINRIFTTRFNLMQLDTNQAQKKELLVKELENTQEEIRKVSHELKQNLLFRDKSFPELIEDYIISQQPTTNIKIDLYIDKYIEWEHFSIETKIHLYRILQELLHNVIKHSRAATCTVTFFKNSSNINIKITDDGVGFSINKLKKGIGLQNIYDRIKTIDGHIDIKSATSSGTQVEIII